MSDAAGLLPRLEARLAALATQGRTTTYGALAAPIGFLLWVWLSIIVIILGGEINGELEHQTAMDTTIGPDRPMGKRGAVMADTLGVASDSMDNPPS